MRVKRHVSAEYNPLHIAETLKQAVQEESRQDALLGVIQRLSCWHSVVQLTTIVVEAMQ